MKSIWRLIKSYPSFYSDHVKLLSRIEQVENNYDNLTPVLSELHQELMGLLSELGELKTQANRVERKVYRDEKTPDGNGDIPNFQYVPTRDGITGLLNMPSGTVLPPDVAKLLGGNAE